MNQSHCFRNGTFLLCRSLYMLKQGIVKIMSQSIWMITLMENCYSPALFPIKISRSVDAFLLGVQVINRYFSVIVSLIPIVAYRDIKIKARFYSDFDFSWTAQKEPMCPRQTAALLGPVGRSTLQKEAVTVCATLQKEWPRSFTEYY